MQTDWTLSVWLKAWKVSYNFEDIENFVYLGTSINTNSLKSNAESLLPTGTISDCDIDIVYRDSVVAG